VVVVAPSVVVVAGRVVVVDDEVVDSVAGVEHATIKTRATVRSLRMNPP